MKITMNTKTVLAASLAAVFAVSMIIGSSVLPAQATGNGAPSGAHYNLNLIGVKKTDQLPNDSNNGHRIFVKLFGNSKILLTEGDFAVIDADATDANGGKFQLPAPCADGTGTVSCGADSNADPSSARQYTVWVRELGKPGGTGNIKTCAVDTLGTADPSDDVSYCLVSVLTVPLQRDTGKPVFTNVTKELTTLCTLTAVGPDGIFGTLDDTCLTSEDIFSDDNKGYYWDYNSDGLKLVQLRFYPVA